MTERIVNPREELRPEGWTQGDDAFSTPTPEWLAENPRHFEMLLLRFKMNDGPHYGCDVVGSHFHKETWNLFWDALLDDERRVLAEKAAWENQTLASVASEWGM